MSIVILLLLAATVLADLTVPEEVKFQEEQVVLTVCTPDHVEIVFDPETILLIDPENWDKPLTSCERGQDTPAGQWTMNIWGPPQRYMVRQIDPKTMQTQTRILKISRDSNPGPGPVPPVPPNPGPGPVLPKGVAILFETKEGFIKNSAATNAAKNALDNAYPGKWRIYDPDLPVDTLQYEDPEMAVLFRYALANGKAPWLIISNGTSVVSQGLPASTDEFLKLLGVAVSSDKMECRFDQFGNRYCTPKGK